MAAMNKVGQRVEKENNIDSAPPPASELLPPDGAVPDFRQQEGYSQFDSSRDQALQDQGGKPYTCLHPKRLYSLTLLSVNLFR